jgi:hypothetical protein
VKLWLGVPLKQIQLSINLIFMHKVKLWLKITYFSKMQNLIQNTRNYTIFIKNDVEFRKFKKKEYINLDIH